MNAETAASKYPPIPGILECFENPRTPEQQEEERAAHASHKELISKLPVETGWEKTILRNYHGFWFPEGLLASTMAIQRRFSFRDDDVILASSMKAGTTWLCSVAFAVLSRVTGGLTVVEEMLSRRHPHDCVVFLEKIIKYERFGRYPDLDLLTSRRILATHTPYSLLPASAKILKCKIVYICRDPKDTVVSLWHFIKELKQEAKQPLTFEKAFELFINDVSPTGPVWDHIMEYWEASVRNSKKVFLVRYEDMIAEPEEQVRRLAEFIGQPFSTAEEEGGVAAKIASICSFEKLSKLEVNKSGETHKGLVENSAFFRKGKVGDWKQHLTPEMARRIDEITLQKLHRAGLSFDYCV